MKKSTSFALLISGIMASISTVAAEKSNENILFSCHTTKNKIIHVVERGKLISYSFSGYGGDSFSFENPKSDVKFKSEVISDLDFYYIEMNNQNYRYIVSYSIDKNGNRTDMGLIGFDKENKKISEIFCREFAEKYQKTDKKNQQEKGKVYQEGTYKVGVDIPAGEYKVIATDKDQTGILFVSNSPNRDVSSVVSHEVFKNSTYVYVKDGQYLRVRSGEFYLVDSK
ncbi:hypothetical protein ACWA5Z_06775 [Testudinibacter sp. P80/BLE/0925]